MDIIKEHPVLSAFAAYGLLKLGQITLQGLGFVWKYLIPHGYDLLNRYGPCWAAITGATGGIGTAYCYALASSGFNLVLIGRNEKKLAELEASIKTRYNKIEIRTLQIDFAKDSPNEFVKKLEAIAEEVDIGFLVNVAGAGHGIEYQLYPYESIEELINVTVIGNSLTTRLLLQQ